MHSFHYRENKLACEAVLLEELAEQYGTPLYVYSSHTILDHYQRLHSALGPLDREICYAVKANSNLSVIGLLAEQGAGFDIVSGGELYRVMKAGGDPAKCTFAGVGKTREEVAFALHTGIYSFNVESEDELVAINDIARSLKKRAPIAVRVNPNVDALTHKYISTGKSENKFGIDANRARDVYLTASKLSHIEIRGIQTHIGSQIIESKPFADAIEKLIPLVKEIHQEFGIEFFSIGGGLGIVYQGSLQSGDEVWWQQDESQHPLSIDEYARTIVPPLQPLPLRVLIEPGRFLVGNAGVLLTRALYVKKTATKTFVIVDAGMNDLIRPALYEGYHEVVPLTRFPSRPNVVSDVVGPVCESGDFFALDRNLPEVRAGELVALMSAGAYGFTMASNYNSRPLPAEVLVTGPDHHLVRRRQNFADLIELEINAEEA